jgi:aminopeptidase N
MTRDAEMAARDYVALVRRGVGGETDIGVVESLLRQAQSAITLYADPAWAPTGRADLFDSVRQMLHAAQPGSDVQLACVRGLCAMASTDEQLSLLSGLLDGSTTLPAFAVGQELRWAMLRRLVSFRRADETAIDAEELTDPTAAGARHAAACRAARPTPEAKREAWDMLVGAANLPNAVHEAVISGFADPDHLDVLEPFIDLYFAAVSDVWTSRAAEMAHAFVVGLYPGYLVSAAVLERTDAFLQSGKVEPGLVRLLLEERDGVVRALRARERDRAAAQELQADHEQLLRV